MTPGPDDTNPAVRAYAIPSCGACLRIAGKHGISIGQTEPEGEIEAVTHADGKPQALCYKDGFFYPVAIEVIDRRRNPWV